ncbi:MAG: hypothetical protein ABSF53_07930 [Terracidiphilus sp.]|jgi:hypothetical protein
MPNDIREFQIKTPDRALTAIRGNLRDAVLEIHRLLSMTRAVVSAYLSEDPSRPIVTGYMDGSGRIEIRRYLNSGSGNEFENWLDADRHRLKSLPEGAWEIERFVGMAPTSVVFGEAVLAVPPHELPRVDFAQESRIRRNHYGKYIVDAIPLQVTAMQGWTAQFVIRDKDGRALGPIGIHTYYESSDRAVEVAISFAETTIDGGITLPELEPQGES